MQKKELKQMEILLLTRKSELLREVEERFKKYQDENSGKLTEIADIASSVFNGDLEISVAEEDIRELKQIDEALVRIRSGNYGTCEYCGKPIKKARLKAIPFATLCVSCKEEEEGEGEGIDRVAPTKCDWENILGSSENGEIDETDKVSSGKKIIDLEYDDNKN